MKINSYGWVLLFICIISIMASIGGEVGFTTKDLPVLANESVTDDLTGVTVYSGAIPFIANMAIANIDGMPAVFTGILWFLPLMSVWIVYRQIRGQD